MDTVIVVSAGLRMPSSTSKLATMFVKELEKDYLVEFVELRKYSNDIMNNLITGFPSPALNEVLDKLYAAKGVVFVTPIFNASFNALFKAFVDILDPAAITYLPVAIAATGGTARHSLVLDYAIRPIFSHLHMPIAEHSVFVATDDWGAETGDKLNPITERVTKNMKEFTDLIKTSKHEIQPWFNF